MRLSSHVRLVCSVSAVSPTLHLSAYKRNTLALYNFHAVEVGRPPSRLSPVRITLSAASFRASSWGYPPCCTMQCQVS